MEAEISRIKVLMLLCAALMLSACSTCSSNSERSEHAPSDRDAQAAVDGEDSAEEPDAQESEDIETDNSSFDDASREDVDEPTQQSCAPFTEETLTGKLAPASIDEASGLAASRVYDGLLWTHNDSGDEARIFLIRSDGALVAEVNLTDIEKAVDWEDIAIGPCEKGLNRSCIYVADIGDNLKEREPVVIYRFPEPELPPDHIKEAPAPQESINLDVGEVHATWFEYPEGPRDAETLMVHPSSAAIYVVEKNDTPNAPVFEVPHGETDRGAPAQAAKIATLYLENLSGLLAMITAGDISPSGREFTVRTYLEAFTFCAPEGEGFDAAFDAEPSRIGLPLLGQAEALAYDLDGNAVWITSENAHAPIYRVARDGGLSGE